MLGTLLSSRATLGGRQTPSVHGAALQQGTFRPQRKGAECGAAVDVNALYTSLFHSENTRTSANATTLRFKEPKVIPDQVFLL